MTRELAHEPFGWRPTTLLLALARLRRAGVDATLDMVGDGPLGPRLKRLADRLGLGPAVQFHGRCEDVPARMAQATLLVLPSAFEGLPLVVLEAMAAGLPVVATRIGGTTEALGPDHPWLTPPGDSRALAAALAAGGTDNGAPGLRPEYHPNYYGAFVLDPDGNNVEAVCHTPEGAA